MKRSHRTWAVGSVLLTSMGLFVGCIEEVPPDDGEETTSSDGGTDPLSSTDPTSGSGVAGSAGIWPGMGGTGGGSTNSCSSGIQPRLTYECAGNVDELAAVDARWADLRAQHPDYACDDGYGYPYYGSYSASTGGAASTSEYSGTSLGGMGGSTGGSTGGGWSMGGIGGSGPGPEPVPVDGWCADVEPGDSIAGISYAVGPCRDTDLATPIRFREPDYGWYQVRVYAGETACERTTLLTETAGYGTGDVVELPLVIEEDAFVSIELITGSYYRSIQVQHQPEVLPGVE